LLPDEAQALEARFGLRVAAHLHMGSQELPHDISERLRVARLQAVSRARQSRRLQTARSAAATASAGQFVNADPHNGTATMMGSGDDRDEAWWMRLGILIPLLLLVAGLVGIDWWHTNEQIQAAAEIDAALLGDDLPPSAYADPGFVEFVASPQPRAE
jgi:hypothetical protein